MIKKYLAVGALMLLVAALAACGGGGGDDSSSGGSSSAAPAPTATTAPAATAKPAGPSNDELVGIGEKAFGTCAGCHGADGTGVTGLGKNLVGSEFITDISDSDLATLIKVGRSSSDPANTTGIDMPPKGGNPALDEAKIDGLVAYIRSLQ
ncbi:MAG: cytochrome c [Chloroflexi bacterium]|nr:cytochrome c [Chloroflexota bacterium]